MNIHVTLQTAPKISLTKNVILSSDDEDVGGVTAAGGGVTRSGM